MPFSQVNFHKYEKVCWDLCSVSHANTRYCFSKICKTKIEFFTNIRMREEMRKTNKSEKKNKQILRYNCSTKRPRKQDKKNVNLILENAMPKAITEVFFEIFGNKFLRSDFLQSSFKVCENYSHPHALYSQCVFLYISFPASTKMFWLVTCPANLEQKLWPSSISYNDCK